METKKDRSILFIVMMLIAIASGFLILAEMVRADTEQEESFVEFRVGDQWLARDNSVWRILANDAAVSNYPVVAMDISLGKVEYFTNQGRAHLNGADSPRDLLRLNEPVISVTNWTMIIRGTPAECTLSKSVADSWKAQGAEVLELKGEWP